MSISNWFQNWLKARRAEQRAAAPDHSARLFVRRLEDRQVLSVSSILVGTDVTFTGDDGGVSADSIIFSVDIDGNLEHNLGGTNGFHSNIDLDNSVAGDQILAVDDITQLSIDLGADSDSVDFADHFDFASGSLSVTAESISATLGSLSVSGLAQFDAGSLNSISLLGVNDFHQVQIVSADNVYLNDINELEFAGASAVTGDLEVTFGSLVTDQLTNAAGASLWVGDMASFSGGSISLGEAVGDTLHFGRLHLDAVGAVVVEEDSATELTGDVFASELRLVSAGDITDTTTGVEITGLASFSGSSISLGGALTNTNFGSLNFSSTGAVAVQEDSATELAGTNSALSLQIVAAGDLTDTSASLMVSDLAHFEGTSITLGGATRSTELGMLTFSSLGDVSIQVDAATQLAGDNAALSLVLDSTGAISDSSSSLNVTSHAELSGSSIAIGGAGLSTNFGSLSFHSLGAVTVQEDSSTQVSSASTAGSLDLQSVGQVQLDATVTVTNGASITADGAISVSNAMSSGGTASLTSQNGVTVDAVIEGATVSIEAADGIVVNARIEAVDAIELTAGTDGSGSVQTALAGDLFASNAGGTATIQIASGVVSGGVLLARATTADSLVRITSASEINGLALITASEIELFAATGIGTLATLQLSGATITAQSTHGNIDLSNAVMATYAQLSTGTGTIAVFNTGAAVFTDVTTTDGAIHLVAVDGDLTVGTNVSAGGADADDNVTLLNANGNIVLTGTTTAIGNQVLAITDGSIGGAGQVSAADVDLQAGTGINANLAAENIRVTTTSGGVQLSNTAISPQTTLDLTTCGDAEVHNTGALSLVGTVDGDLTVMVTAGDLTDSGPLSVSGTSSLLAAGDVILDHTSNDFGGAVAVSGQAVELIDANSLTLGQIDAVTVQVTASGSITLGTGAGEDLEATDCVQLHADSGGVVQQAGSTILTDRLALTGTGPFTLEQANDVNVLAVNIDGSIHFADSNALIVGTACGVSGLATSGQDARLSTGGNLTIGEAGDLGVNDVSLGTGDLTLDVTGAITQLSGNTISATGLQLLGGGGPAQLSESNSVAILAVDRDGTIEFTNSAALTVGTVTETAGTLAVSTSGVTTSGDDVRLIVLGDLLIDEAISLGAGALSLNVTGTISQNAGDTITAAGLSLSGNGAGAELGEANDVDTFASDYQGTVLLSDIDDLTVGSVTAVGATTIGISNTLDTKLTTGGDLHLAEAVDLGPGTLLLDVDGVVTQSATGTITASGLALMVTGRTTLDQANDVDALAADTQGTLLFNDVNDLTVGSVTSLGMTVTGIRSTFDAKLTTGRDLQLAEAVDLGAGNLFLDVDGDVTQSATGTITAAGLALMVSGGTTLDQANDVETLAAQTLGSVEFHDVDDLQIGIVSENASPANMTITGVTVDDANFTVSVGTGNLTLEQAIDTGAGDVRLEATTGSILDGQDGLTQITAHNLSLTAQTQIGEIVDFAAGTGDAIDVSLTGQLTQASVTDAGGEIFLSFQGDLSAASGAVNVGGSNAASAILRATGGDIDVGTAIGVFSLSSGDNLALEAIEIAGAGGTLVLPDAGLDVGVGDLRLRGDVDVRDAADRNLGPLVADDLHFTSGAGSADTTLTTRINTLTAQITGSGAGLTVIEADGLVLTDIDLVNGDLEVHASQSTAGDIEVIDVAVGDARITLDTTAHGGSQIVDADTLDDPNRADLTATEIDLRAGTGIAHGAKLEIVAERLAAITVRGQINIRDVAGDLTIAALARGTAGVSVTAGVTGDDICISTVGALTVDADVSNSGTGDREILLAADGDTAAHDLTVNADITATGGNSSITLLAGDSILFAGMTVTSAAGTGAVQARAGRVLQNGGVESAGSASGDILMSDGSIIQSDNGTITLSAPNDIQLSVINANAAGVDGEIVLTAAADGSGSGQIREVLSGESSNLIADHVTLTAAGGIGTADDIDTTVESIEATNTTSGSIIIHETDALAITGTGLQTQAGNGNVHVTIDAGALTVDSAVSAHGSGDVTLTATSGAAELNAEISSTSGDIQIAGDSVAQSSDITTGGTGTIQVVADTGSITMADGTQTSTELGSIYYSAAEDIAISLIRSDSGPISITADSDNSLAGAIIDNTAIESANLATGGTLTLLAATGIGSGDDLNANIGLLVATNTTSGDIAIREADGLIVTGSGVRSQGGGGDISLVVDDGALVMNSLITAHGSGNVILKATQGPAELNATVRSTSGNLTITADAVNQNSGGDLETGSSGTIEVTADAGSITMADGTASTTSAGNILYSATGDVRLSHLSSRSGDLTVRAGAGPSAVGAIIDNTVDELPNLQTTGSATLIAETGIGASDDIDTAVSRLDVTNSTRGAIQITEVDAVQIVQLSQSGGGHVFVQTTNGTITVDNANVTPQAIRVSGGGSLVLDANGVGANVIVNDAIQSIGGDITLLADRNIETHSAAVATTGGDGDLTLAAGRDVRILDPGNLNPIDLQATGSGIVSLRAANELVLGSQDPGDPSATQHTTLNDVVVASQTGQITNTLPILFDVRSPQVTAEGEAVLSVTIGRPGETNLAVRVYWGDGTVETFTGLVAGTYTYRHFYTANPNPLDPAAPILVNVQVAHDPKILLVAPNVNSSVLSVLNGAIAIPPPVPTPNINADLAKAIYNPGDPLFPTLQGQIVSSPGSEAAPGTVVFQDTTFLATTIPVPGEGLATFVFDTTPPVKLLDFPEGIKIVDTLPPSTVQVSEGTAAQLVAEGADDAASGERQVILEVISPTGEVIQQAVLPESTLDDLQTIIGRLPDGQYRFQLKEAGEDRLRLLLEFEVRQGKIADETDATDRPPSNKKPAATEPMEPDAEEEAPDQNEARLLLPELPDDDDSVHSPVTPKPPRAVSMAARRAWKQAAEITSPDHTLDETDPADATASDDSDTQAAALGVMVAVVGAGLAVPERRGSQRVLGPQLGRVSRLLRRVRSTASGLSTENRQLNANELATPMVLPLGERTSC